MYIGTIWMVVIENDRRAFGMKKGIFKETFIEKFVETFGVIFIVTCIIGVIGAATLNDETRCIEKGCHNKKTDYSDYCEMHESCKMWELYYSREKSDSGNSYKSSDSGNSGKSYNSANSHVGSGYKRNSSWKTGSSDNSYDEGYDSIYDDWDYDYDRYGNDSDYADGVDDAIYEVGGDW